jgi:hypothetical protein
MELARNLTTTPEDPLFITDQQRYGLPKVIQRSSWPVFVTKGKAPDFEVLEPTLDCCQTDGDFSKNSTQVSIYRLISLPVQEEGFHHASFARADLF